MQRSYPEVEAFYHSKAWINCRNSFMDAVNYICNRCGSPAAICHHKEYITINNINNPDITLNWDNLEPLCLDCHNKEHFKQDDGYFFNEDGDIYFFS